MDGSANLYKLLGIKYPNEIARPVKKTGNRLARLRSRIAFPVGCFWCGKSLTQQTHTFDHVIPKSKGGTLSQGNLIDSCAPCNSERGNTPFILFMLQKFKRKSEKPTQNNGYSKR